MDIILASGSPRRKQLLAQMGIETFRVISSDADETVEPGLSPARIVEILSARKAEAVADHAKPGGLVIAADTIVWHEGCVLGKPRDREQAIDMLRSLSASTHRVYTGVALTTVGWQRSFVAETAVRFAALTDEEITFYVDTYRPFDKAGAYGVQEWIGYIGVEYIAGSYFNVMGLPVQRLYQELKAVAAL